MIRVNTIIRRATCRFGLMLLAVAFVSIQSAGAKADLTSARMSIVEGNVQKAPAYFKFQSRISQGKIPLGDVTFNRIIVNIKDGAELVCSETFKKVQVQDSVLNLEIGRGTNGTCDMDSVAAKHSDLQFVVCLNSSDNCLKPVSFASVPYAVKANYAVTANKASRANEAVQCHYAHRVTADRDLFLTQSLGKGYFDFYTPTQEYFDSEAKFDGMFWYEDTAQSVPDRYKSGGYIQWAGMSEDGNNLHICASASNAPGLPPIPLDELVMHADLSRFAGQLVVEGPATGTAPGAVFKKGVQVGYEKDKYRLVVWDSLEVNGTSDFNGDVVAKKVTVGDSAGFVRNENAPPIFEVYGNAEFYGEVNLATDAKLTIPTDSVKTQHIDDGEVTAADLRQTTGQEAVVTAAIRDGAVDNSKLDGNAVHSRNIKNGEVKGEDIASSAIDSSHIENQTIQSWDIAAGACGNSEIRVNAVTSDKIKNGEVTGEDIAQQTIGSENIQLRAVSNMQLNLQISRHTFDKNKDCPWLCMKNLGSSITLNACFLTTVPFGKGCQVKINNSTKQWQMIGNDPACEAMCF